MLAVSFNWPAPPPHATTDGLRCDAMRCGALLCASFAYKLVQQAACKLVLQRASSTSILFVVSPAIFILSSFRGTVVSSVTLRLLECLNTMWSSSGSCPGLRRERLWSMWERSRQRLCKYLFWGFVRHFALFIIVVVVVVLCSFFVLWICLAGIDYLS